MESTCKGEAKEKNQYGVTDKLESDPHKHVLSMKKKKIRKRVMTIG